MTTVKIYGFTDGWGSYAQVTRGVALGLEANQIEGLSVAGIEREADFVDDYEDLPTADVAILTGPPAAAAAMLQGGKHARRMAFVHPNSNKLPVRVMAAVNQVATHILAASKWSAPVIAQYTKLPIVVVPHGIHPDFRVIPPVEDLEQLYERGRFRVLHLSSSGRQRKGTLELIAAWNNLMKSGRLPKESELELVLVPEGRQRVLEWITQRGQMVPGLKLSERFGTLGASPSELAAHIYNRVHVVCQPSRGEAFGLTPTEALACGVPIVATRCTGHSEWYAEQTPGTVEVRTTGEESIDDMPDATAPGLNEAHVELALRVAYMSWHAIKADALGNAERLREERSWGNQMKEFTRWLREGV